MRPLILILAVFSACRSSPPREESPFQEGLLGRIPEGSELVLPIAFSEDGRETAFILRTADGCRAVRGSWKSPRLDSL